MVGGDIHVVGSQRKHGAGTVRLQLKNLNLPADGPFVVELRNISIDV